MEVGQAHARLTWPRPTASYCTVPFLQAVRQYTICTEQTAQVFPFRREQSTDFCQPKKQRPTLETYHHSASSLSVNL